MLKKLIVPVMSLGLFLVTPGFAAMHGNGANGDNNANAATMKDCPHKKSADHEKAKKQWMQTLNLTPEQKEKMKSMRKTYKSDTKDDYKKMRQLRHDIMTLSHEPNVDEAKLDLKVKEHQELAHKLMKEKLMMKNKMFHVLNPEQQQKYKEMKQKMMDKYKDKHDNDDNNDNDDYDGIGE